MYDPTQIAQPMNYSDLFMAQNLGLQPSIPAPMSGAQSMPQSMPMSGPQNVQMPPEINHLADVVQQYTQNKNDQQNNSGLVQQILSNRMQPDTSDASKSIFLSNQNGPGGYVSPDQTMADRYKNQLAPFTQGLGLANQSAELSGRLMNNNITAQTGLPMAMAQLKAEQMKNDIMAQTGMSAAQADIALKNSQAGYYGSVLQRDIAEKQFEYANDPQMQQAKMMAAYMQSLSGTPNPQANAATAPTSAFPTGGMSMPGNQQIQSNTAASQPNLPQAMQQNAQPAASGGGFNPMGAMLAKSLGLTDMQIGPNGQPMPIPGAMKIENGSVITIGPDGKPQSNIPVNPRAQGLFEQKLQDISDKIEKLHAIGGTVEEGGGFVHNKLTQMAATQQPAMFGMIPSGQSFLQGTQAQSLRDDIQADVKQALPLYMQAFGITPGMERAASAQQMLQDAIGGAVGKSRQHLRSNLVNLSQTAGTGQLAAKISAEDAPKSNQISVVSPDGRAGTIDPSELQPALANGWKMVQ